MKSGDFNSVDRHQNNQATPLKIQGYTMIQNTAGILFMIYHVWSLLVPLLSWLSHTWDGSYLLIVRTQWYSMAEYSGR